MCVLSVNSLMISLVSFNWHNCSGYYIMRYYYSPVAGVYTAGGGSGDIFMTDVGCGGGEGELSDCPASIPDDTCGHDKDAGVICLSI